MGVAVVVGTTVVVGAANGLSGVDVVVGPAVEVVAVVVDAGCFVDVSAGSFPPQAAATMSTTRKTPSPLNPDRSVIFQNRLFPESTSFPPLGKR